MKAVFGAQKKILVVAAWEPELARFRQRLETPGLLSDVVLHPLGVGLVEAGIEMALCIERYKPDVALLLGTAGVMPGDHPIRIGDVVAVSEVHVVDAGIMGGTSEIPGPMPRKAVLDPTVLDALTGAGAKGVSVANPVGITVTDRFAVDLARAGFAVEHLEAFAFARACHRAGVRAGIALGIANVVGSAGRTEWLANHVRASALAGDFAWNALFR